MCSKRRLLREDGLRRLVLGVEHGRASRDGTPLLTINGIQTQTAGRLDLGPELGELRSTGIELV